MASTTEIATFRQTYQLRAMKITPANDDQVKQMRREDGMLNLEDCGMALLLEAGAVGEAPADSEAAKKGCFLWAVRGADTPVALERCDWGQGLESKELKHSNLTGGSPAHSGGELWAIKNQGLLVNANSGRYGAESPEELDAFVGALQGLGFRVGSMGFDLDNPKAPNTVQVGPVDWRNPHE